jgi:queuosine precursor transporter
MSNHKLFYVLAIYIAALFASNLLGMKTTPFLFGTHLSLAIFFMPILFITMDIVGQVYGREMSKRFIYAGFIALIFFTLGNLLISVLPWADVSFGRIGEAYDTIFSLSWRISIASLTAYFLSEYIDVIVFFAAKRITANFFIASTLSNIVSQAIDTVVFMTIAFA